MIKELYKKTIKEISLNVTQSKIDSVRKKTITKSGCRVYNNGYIGIEGTLGEPTENTWKKAETNLLAKVPYISEPEKDRKHIRDLRKLDISDKEFISTMENILDILHKEYPDFIFSNKINMVETEISMTNDVGLHYINYDKTIDIELLIKHVDSFNIFDTVILNQSRDLEDEAILIMVKEMIEGYKNKVDIPDSKKSIIIIQQSELLRKIEEELNGEAIGREISLFNEKINSKAFSDKVTIYQDSTEDKFHTPFFDMEGVINENDKYNLIEKGVIKNAYTDKKSSIEFSMPLTGAASGSYDEVPALSGAMLSIKSGGKNLKELLNGELAILVIAASGGDFTSEGNFASPVQMAMITDGEHIIGRLPEFNISGNLYEMFGEDFVGVSEDKPFIGENALVVKMKIN
jgi:PmbA protein